MTDPNPDRKLYEATTPGEWKVDGPSNDPAYNDTVTADGDAICYDMPSHHDAAWIAHAHKRWPELLDEIERLKTELSTLLHCRRRELLQMRRLGGLLDTEKVELESILKRVNEIDLELEQK